MNKQNISIRMKELFYGNIEETTTLYEFENIQLNLEVSSLCNEKCIYCPFYHIGAHKKGLNIDENLFNSVAKQAYDIGIREVGLYASGEPLCNPNVGKHIKYLKELGYKYIYISTNGLLCNLSKTKEMVEAGLDSLKFTISAATKENFKKHHGVDGFEVVKKNLIDAYNYRKENGKTFKIFLFFVTTQYNQSEVEMFKKMFSPFCDEIIFDNVLDFVVPLIGLKEKLHVGGNEFFDREIPCRDLWNRVCVGADGKVYMCCSLYHESMQVFDLKNGSLLDAINSEKMIELRKEHLSGRITNDVCTSCLIAMSGQKSYSECKLGCIDIRDEIKNRFGE